ncbi:MAG: DciA family protein [Gammaproteobacteria bacterium]|nr:DciA family protein [Gammaproteobacteria bacterium]
MNKKVVEALPILPEKSNCYDPKTLPLKSTAGYLSPDNQTLGSLLGRVKQMQTLHTRLSEALPDQKELFQHCYVLRPDATSLLLIAENPHWVTRLRFLVPALHTALKKYSDLAELRAIYCKVQPPLYQNRFIVRKKYRRMEITSQSAALFEEAAAKIKDPKISRILKKLAAHSNRIE